MATSKKMIMGMVLAFSLLGSIAVGAWWLHSHSSTPDYAAGKCSDYYTGLYDPYGVESISTMANVYSKAIIVATVEDPKILKESIHIDDAPPLLKLHVY
jgi:hypothetical protein